MNHNEKCKFCGAEENIYSSAYPFVYKCGSPLRIGCEAIIRRTDLCREREAHNKTMEREAGASKIYEELLSATRSENQKLRELCENVISDLSEWDKGNALAWKYLEQLNQLTK